MAGETKGITLAWLIYAACTLALLGAAGGSQDSHPVEGTAAAPNGAVADALVRVLASDDSGVTLELTVPRGAVSTATMGGRPYDIVSVPGLSPGGGPGRPDLPRKVVMLGIPPGAELKLAATALEVETLPGRYRIAPVPRWIAPNEALGPIEASGPANENPAQGLQPVYEADRATYEAAFSYPAELARLLGLGTIRSQRVASLELVPFRYYPANAELQQVRRLRVRLDFVDADGSSQSRGSGLAEDASFEAILARSLLNYDSARAWRSAPGASAAIAAAPWTPPDPAWKISIDETGLYQLTRADLEAAGLPVDSLDPRTLRLCNRGVEVAIGVAGEEDGRLDAGDGLEFYGQGVDTLTTDTNVYWLTYGGAAGLRMATRDGTPRGAPSPASFVATAVIEEQRAYWSSSAGADHWFWQRMYAISTTHSITSPLTAAFTGTLGYVAGEPAAGTVRVFLHGATYNNSINPDHHALLYLNNHSIADLWWDGQVPYSTTLQVPASYLSDITNTLRVDMPADTGSLYDGIYVDKMSVEYGQSFRAVDGELAFAQRQSGTWLYRVGGLAGPAAAILDVTDPAHVVRITTGPLVFLPLAARGQPGRDAAPTAGGSGGYMLRFQDTVTGTAEYLVLTAGRVRGPLSIVADRPSSLSGPANQADYVIIAHDELYTSALPLASYWQAQGMAVDLVRVSDVYDEFAYGLVDPTAIRDFLAYAYTTWQGPPPAYLLLVGDGTYDYKNFTGLGVPPGIPAPLIPSPYIGETASDNWYACIAGDDSLPDLHVGRLPAANAAQAGLLVAKTLAYAQHPPPGSWNQHVLLVADNADADGDYAAFSEALQTTYLPPGYTPHKTYYKVTHALPAQVTAAITRTLNTTGTLLVNYAGHGAVYSWAGEKLLFCYGSRCDMHSMTNAGKLPFVVSMACYDGYYVHPDPAFVSLAENWLLDEDGGAVAAFAATGLGAITGHVYLDDGLFLALFADRLALGPATTAAKLYVYSQTGSSYQDLIDTYHLFGDPALSLNLP